MAVAAVLNYNFRPQTHQFAGRRKSKKAENGAVSSRFQPLSVKAHCIKDSVKIDPACGSGNFLTETYISLRRLENRTIEAWIACSKRNDEGQIAMGEELNPIRVSISQFHGIEINDFAVTVAKTALWIAESQMLKETEQIVFAHLDFLPLKTNAYIHEGNALRMDWESLVPKSGLSYIMGNPPFVGYSLQSKAQKEDILSIYVDEDGKPYKSAGKIDYVSGWYFKAAQLMQGTSIRTAFVSTNSITQGEQVAGVWKPLYDRFGIHIDFAHRTFRWDSEANSKAHVHCVIVGFSIASNPEKRRLYTGERVQLVDNINAYLINAENLFIENRTTPISDAFPMHRGSQPTDNGNFIFSEEEYQVYITKEPDAKPLFRKYMMGKDFIARKPRYCLWLQGVNPSTIKKFSEIMKRIDNVRLFRLSSSKEATQKKANTPTLFDENQQPSTNFVALPKVSSERRRYIPMDFMSPDIVVGDKIYIVENATPYHFGVLTSNIHMAWMRAVCGRLKSDYSYSNTIVYNNFPWPEPTEAQKAKIEQTAQAILDARALYPDSSLADLYDELTMPPELRLAHQRNDRAVMEAYGITKDNPAFSSEAACVALLMKLYQEKVKAE